MSFEVHAVNEPLWIRALVEDVLVDSVTPIGFVGPLGYRWWEPGNPVNTFDGWQVVVFPTPNEARGPVPMDGCRYVNGFSLDVGKIAAVMHDVKSVVWNAPVKYNGNLDGPELSVQGTFLGRQVWLRFFQLPPPDEPCAFFVNPVTGQATERPV